MEQIEITKRAKNYIDSLANGVNPLDGSIIDNDSVLNDARIVRCLFYVSGILDKVIENGGEVTKGKKPKRQKFALTDEQKDSLAAVRYERIISEIASEINNQIDTENMRRISAAKIADWLVEKGFLTIEERNGKNKKVPTEDGAVLGIKSYHVNGQYGEYDVNRYDINAQRFIYDNMDEIIEFAQRSKKPKRQPFTLTDEQTASLKTVDYECTASEIAGEINNQIDTENMQKISAKRIADWLLEKGFFTVEVQNGQNKKVPTENGIALGIKSYHVTGTDGEYDVNRYDPNAQQFIYDNMDEIIEFMQR